MTWSGLVVSSAGAPTVAGMTPRPLFTPAQPRLVLPGTRRRILHGPDLRGLLAPAQLSGQPLVFGEQDYDDLTIHRSWRAYDDANPGVVRYFMYEYSQTLPGETKAWHGYKAVRLIRLTRVPRYLRFSNAQAGPNVVFEQMRDVLAALREQQCRFLQVVAKSPELPLVFAYGVQAIGATPEEAQLLADESYAVLDRQLQGTYQQLRYQPLDVAQGELLARYQAEWGHLAMARGRPLPVGNTLSTGAILSDARSDVESTNNQLESFIRGMSTRSFMLTLVTTPINVAEMSLALANIARKVSEVRSDQEGQRGVNAGVAIPLSMGATNAVTHGGAHTTGLTHTDGTSTSVTDTQGTSTSHSLAAGTSESTTATHGTNHGVSDSKGTNSSVTDTQGTSQSHTDGTFQSQSVGTSHSVTEGTNQSTTTGTSHAVSEGTNQSTTTGTSHAVTEGSNQSTTKGVSDTTTHGTSSSSSLGSSKTATASASATSSSSATKGTSLTGTASSSSGSSVHGGVPGIGGANSTSSGNSLSSGQSNSATQGNSSSSGNSLSNGTSATNTSGVNSSSAVSTSSASTVGTSNSVTDTTSQSATAGTSNSVTDTTSQSATVGTSNSVTDGTSQTSTTGTSQSDTTGTNQSVAVGQGVTATQGTNAGASTSLARSTGSSLTSTDGTGTNQSHAVGSGTNQSNAAADSYSSSMALAAGQMSSFAVSPYMGVSISRRTFDSAKKVIGDLLEAQQARYIEGVKSGAFFYQMFLLAPDRETLVGGAGLLKSAFWGSGSAEGQLPQPFHVLDTFGETEGEHLAELRRLRLHAQVFTQYAKREYRPELIEPYMYSSYLTPTEGAAFCHPPVAESVGLMAVHDSMPVLAMPANRADRDVHLGHIINGELADVTDQRYGFDLEEITHVLVTGVTGFGKTTSLMRMLVEIAGIERQIVTPPTPRNPVATQHTVRASVLGFDWAQNMRNLAGVVEPERFRFYSIRKPSLGAFRWNPLAIPHPDITPAEWLNTLADNFMASMNFGPAGRSIIADALGDLYAANRLAPFILRPAIVDENGTVLRPAEVLDPIDRATLPPEAIQVAPDGAEYANVMSFPELSRLVSMGHLATIVAAFVEANATVEAARLRGTSMRDYVQTVWRGVSPFAPGGSFDMITCDPSLDEHHCLTVTDLVDPDRGLVSIIETEGLDMANRRFILGSVILAVYRYGLAGGEGVFNHDGKGPGTFIVLEEAHELFGSQGTADDRDSLATRTALYESLFRRCRALGIRLVTLVQNPASIPSAVTSNTSTVIVHTTFDDEDRKKVFSLLNWSANLTQQLREYRYLGEMAPGEAIVRLPARTSWLDATPVLVKVDSPDLARVGDDVLAELQFSRSMSAR